MIIVADAGPDGAPVRFDPGSVLAMPAMWGEKPLDQPIPVKLLPGQKAPPCESALSQEAIHAGCWIGLKRKPPCGPYFRRGDECYAPRRRRPEEASPGQRPDRPSVPSRFPFQHLAQHHL